MLAFPRAQYISAFNQRLYAAFQAVFAIIVIMIFVMTWAVQSGAVKVPQWGKAWDTVSSDTQDEYAAVLVPSTCILFVLFLGGGLLQMRRQARVGR
ncbi:uncharacterized protein BCR38DRAFT_118308 [Pseudomassariella vexata]|uniref:Uncharacterized protein n=1 Tax=Pseudomassariella vexata TaxID=1141098 RepID=A0A1Y2DAU3_9PEZI|nr:uncharacterized protein BCR38DRAFT_118308 [Pseudomassariella vexata]ORY56390.1 hypothetical protein BCR38DRAFT_118308 [Pseudomassariella vexata]